MSKLCRSAPPVPPSGTSLTRQHTYLTRDEPHPLTSNPVAPDQRAARDYLRCRRTGRPKAAVSPACGSARRPSAALSSPHGRRSGRGHALPQARRADRREQPCVLQGLSGTPQPTRSAELRIGKQPRLARAAAIVVAANPLVAWFRRCPMAGERNTAEVRCGASSACLSLRGRCDATASPRRTGARPRSAVPRCSGR